MYKFKKTTLYVQDEDVTAAAVALLAEGEGKCGETGDNTEVYDCTHVADHSAKKRRRHTG